MRQRRAQRHKTSFSCSARVQGQQVEVVIETLSYEGFGLRCRRALLIGSEIVLDLPIVGATRAKIRWALGGAAGGVFQAQLSDEMVARITSSAPGGENSDLAAEAGGHHPTVGTRSSTITLPDGMARSALLLSLTNSGAVVELPNPPSVGTDLLLQLDQVATPAIVSWSGNGRSGLQFLAPPKALA
jgi:hypothetical protein